MRGSVVAAAVALALQPAAATTYETPTDFGVTCLDLATGKVVWQATGALGPPTIRVAGELVIADDGGGKPLVLQAKDGAVAKQRATKGGTAGLARLPANLADANGRTLKFSPGNTDTLTDGKTTFLELDWYPEELAVAGRLALFSFSSPVRAGGEVYAWDLDAAKLVWVFRGADHVKDLPATAVAYFAIDGDRVLVSSDQHVFSIELATGAFQWETALPRQKLRPYDAPWTWFGRSGELVIARVYDRLFALKAKDGALAWSFDGGMLAQPWPTIVGDRAYIASRTGGVKMMSTSFASAKPTHPPSAVSVTRDKAGTITIEARDRRDLPKGATLWGSLRRPPPPPVRSNPIRTVLELDSYRPIAIDLTSVLSNPGTAWVQFDGLVNSATVKIGDKRAATIGIPDSL